MNAKILVLLAVVNIVRCRDIVAGSKEGGRKIYDENKQANPAIWRQIENVTIAANDDEVISKILITDLRADKDGDAKIVEGGEGKRNVTIELKSPTVLRGYDFHIEIFAIPGDSQKGTAHKLSTEKAITNTITSSDVHETSSTTQGPSTTVMNLRQNRDTETKEKTGNKTELAIQKNTSLSTEASKSPLTESPPNPLVNREIKNEEPEQKFPIVNRGFPQEAPFGHPNVRVYEVSEMPESTARGIPSEGPLSNGNRGDHEDKNMQLPFNMDKMYTHINYPGNNAHDYNHVPAQMGNTGSPYVKNEDNKNHRQKRNANEERTTPPAEKKDNQKPFTAEKADNDKKPAPNQNDQSTQTIKQSSIGIDKQLDSESKPVNKQEITHSGFHPRQLQRSLTNIPPVASSPSSINVQRFSHPLPTYGELTQEASKRDLDPEPIEPKTEILSSSVAPSQITITTPKTKSIAELNPKQKLVPIDAVSTAKADVSEAIKDNKRNARDTTDVSDKNDFLQPPALQVSSTTAQPIFKNTLAVNSTNDVTNKNVTEINVNKPIVPSDKTKASHPNDQSERNTRDTKKDEEKTVNAEIDTKISIDAIKATNESDHKSNNTVAKPQTDVKVPVELTHEKTKVALKDEVNKDDVKSTEEKERLTRDTSSIDKAKPDGKSGSTHNPTTTDSETKIMLNDAKVNSEKAHFKKETSKQVVSTTDKKANQNKDVKTQNIKDVRDNIEGDQSLEIPKLVGSPHTDIPLSTDLMIDSGDKTTSVKETIKTEEKKPIDKDVKP